MIRKLIHACANSKIPQNLESDIWILSMDSTETQTEVVVFNRMFEPSHIHSLTFLCDDTPVKTIHETQLDDGCVRCILDITHPKQITVKEYCLGDTCVKVDHIKLYHVEFDVLTSDRVAVLKQADARFEVMPSFSNNEWQCMCSYVNTNSSICKRCGQSKQDNITFTHRDIQAEMLEGALRTLPDDIDDMDEALSTLSETYNRPLNEVKQMVQVIQQEHKHVNHSDTVPLKRKKYQKKHILILGLVCVLVISFVSLRPLVSRYKQYQAANALFDQGNYTEARALYKQDLGFLSSREKVVQSVLNEVELLMLTSSTDDFMQQNISMKLSELDNVFDPYQESQKSQSILRDQVSAFAMKYIDTDQYEVAMGVVFRLLNFEDPFSTEFKEIAKAKIINSGTTYDYIIYWWYFSYGNDLTDLYEALDRLIQADILPNIHNKDADINELIDYLSVVIQYATQLVHANPDKYLDTVLEVLYQGQLLMATYDNYYVNNPNVPSILYSQNYKDSRTAFDPEKYALYNYWIEHSQPMEEGTDENSVALTLYPNETSFTLVVELVGEFDPTMEITASIMELGIEDKPFKLSSDGRIEIPIDLLSLQREIPQQFSVMLFGNSSGGSEYLLSLDIFTNLD